MPVIDATFTSAVPSAPGLYLVRSPDSSVHKLLLYLHGGQMWIHRPCDRDAIDVMFVDAAFKGCTWAALPPEWIDNGPNAPRIQVGDIVLLADPNSPKGRLSGFVTERGPGWLKIAHGPTIPVSSVEKFMPRHGAVIPTGTASLPVNHF